MSFTQDELQSLNSIVDQKVAAHRHELERFFDQRLNILKQEFETRITILQQGLLRQLPQQQEEHWNRLREALQKNMDQQQIEVNQSVQDELKSWQQQQQQHLENTVENALAAQLLAIEQLIHQKGTATPHVEVAPVVSSTDGSVSDIDTLEVQTEISWEELVGIVGNALDDRMAALDRSLQSSLKNMERYLSTQLQKMREQFIRDSGQVSSGGAHSLPELFASIEQLERIIESMQVAMTANHALLSNRLYHHQQLPLERAHSASQMARVQTSPFNGVPAPTNGSSHQLPEPREQEHEA